LKAKTLSKRRSPRSASSSATASSTARLGRSGTYPGTGAGRARARPPCARGAGGAQAGGDAGARPPGGGANLRGDRGRDGVNPHQGQPRLTEGRAGFRARVAAIDAGDECRATRRSCPRLCAAGRPPTRSWPSERTCARAGSAGPGWPSCAEPQSSRGPRRSSTRSIQKGLRRPRPAALRWPRIHRRRWPSFHPAPTPSVPAADCSDVPVMLGATRTGRPEMLSSSSQRVRASSRAGVSADVLAMNCPAGRTAGRVANRGSLSRAAGSRRASGPPGARARGLGD
jgi:hypothetical protein